MKRKNGWFIAAGVLSIIEAVALVVCELVFIIPLVTAYLENQGSFAGALVAFVAVIVGLFLILMLVPLVFAIVNAVWYLKNASKTHEQLCQSRAVIAIIVFSFMFGVIIVGVLGLLGYLLKPEEKSLPAEEKTSPTEEV